MYCSLVTSVFVLQYSLVNCIAGEGEKGLRARSVLQYTGLYCREEGSIVLQDCIGRGLAGDNLYRNTMDCIVTETGQCCIAIQSL